MLKIESCSAMYETLSAVASAVSVTQRFRAPFEIGCPLSSFAAADSSLVPAGSSGFAAAPHSTGRARLAGPFLVRYPHGQETGSALRTTRAYAASSWLPWCDRQGVPAFRAVPLREGFAP